MFRHGRSPDDFEAEIQSHLELEAEQLQAEGRTGQEAHRRARIGFGSVVATRERFYEGSHAVWLENLLRDFRFALRSLKKNWRFSFLAILALSLGIGSATVIFSAIYGVILNTFPFKNPGQVTSFGIQDLSNPSSFRREFLSMPEFLAFRSQSHAFSDVSAEYGGFGSTPVQYTAGESTFEFSADYMSVNSFGFFGVKPVLGRLPSEQNTRAGAMPVFMMSYKLWRRQFDSNPNIIGRSFMLSGVARTLVGIMPPRFRWGWADLWVPFPVDQTQIDADPQLAKQFVWCVGRLKPGVTLKTAEADLDVIAHRLARIYPQEYPKRFTVTATRLSDRVTGPFKSLILPLLGAVLMLLLIACSNVANLILARATVREKEIAVCGAVGASRARIVQQFLMESFVLAAAGCVVGCALAYLGIKAVVPIIPYNAFPQEAVITLNPWVLLCSLGVALLATLACSLVPAVRAVRGNLQSRLIGANTGSSSQSRHGKGRAALVIIEVALSIVLLVGTGLMVRTFLTLTHVDLGFDPSHILTAQLALPISEFKDTAARNRFVRTVLDRISGLPGVDAAAESLSTPPRVNARSGITVPGRTHSERWSTALDFVSEGYFRTFDYHLLRGRLLTLSDVDQARHVVIVNRTFAQRFFGGGDPVGHVVQFAADFSGTGSKSAQNQPYQIVGVVLDEKNNGLIGRPQPEAFLPYTLLGPQGPGLLVKTSVDPASLLPGLRHLLWTIDPKVALGDAGSLQSILQRDTFASPRFEAIVLGAFALIGTLLVVIGIYSVMAYTVSLRTHEMGVRMALGASQGDILRLVLGKDLVLILIGVSLGLLASVLLTRYLAHLIWGISLMDPWTYGGVVIGVIAIGMLSCFSPARRATRVDPSVALRYE
ncbi:MAG: ABC transporter permease [Acidobacteriaceae bacterium]